MPDLSGCTSCGKSDGEGGPAFSAETGGLLCRDCEPGFVEKRAISPDTLAWLRDCSSGEATRRTEASAFDLLNYHIGYHLGRPPKLADYVLPAAQRRQL